MKLYRIVDDEELEKALNKGVFESSWKYYEENQGWGMFQGTPCRNTFTYDQNQNLHFFPFSIDAVQYLYMDTQKENSLYKYAYDSFCVFDITEEMLEQGYGFYPNKVAPEYVSKGPISTEYLLWHTKDKKKMFEEVLGNIEEISKWYSMAGKAFQMIIDRGISSKEICGVRTPGGFIYSFGIWFTNTLLGFLPEQNVKEIISYCHDVNKKCYKDLDFIKDRSVLSDMSNKYANSAIKDGEELSIIFKDIEKKYRPEDVIIEANVPKLNTK